jgi:hypothetical protein
MEPTPQTVESPVKLGRAHWHDVRVWPEEDFDLDIAVDDSFADGEDQKLEEDDDA